MYISNAINIDRLSEAQQQKLSPWFNPDRLLETEKTSTQNADLDTFLESLS